MQIDLEKDSQSLVVRKKPIPVEARFAESDGILQTLEGEVRYRKGDALLTGSGNDSWPVARDRFDQTYVAVDPEQAKGRHLFVKREKTVLASRLSEPRDLTLSANRGVLHGKPGDWLVQYAPDDVAIVSAAIFEATYEIVLRENPRL